MRHLITEETHPMRPTKDWLSRNWQPELPKAVSYRTRRLDAYTVRSMEMGDGPPLLFVPGLAGGSSLHLPLLTQLAQYFRITTFEFRGEDVLFTRNNTTSLHTLADDLAEFIHLGGWERPYVLGTSYGGILSLLMAKKHPGLIQSLVVQGVGDRFQPGVLRYLTGQILNRFPLMEANPFIRQVFTMLLGGANVPARLIDFAMRQSWTTDQAVMARRFRSVARLALAEQIQGLSVPTLMLTGNRDIIVTKSSAEHLASNLTDCRMIPIHGGGHLAGITHPAEIASHTWEFCREFAMVG
ncbi:MAG: alpha/beta hydrolase [Planctomycetota bacterium]|nr:alpha/beta hydrolase [Planctomycetota bacterium]